MNFFGHAAVAAWQLDSPQAVLGAMVPDLASMARTRLKQVHDPQVAVGVRHHYRTDDVFHAAPPFVRMCADAAAELEGAGVARGSARAVAHVGTELLLDGWLATEGEGARPYVDALDAADEPVIAAIELRHADGHGRLRWLLDRLRAHGVPRRYDEPGFVADRLVQVLEPRPRLRLRDGDRALVARWATGFRRRVRDEAPALVDHVRRALEAPAPEA